MKRKRIRTLITFTTNAEINNALETERRRIAHDEKLEGQFAGTAQAVRSLILRGAAAKVKAVR